MIALGEHVDYWDHGGWADRFSSHRFTLRQNDYARAFRKDTVYTPQMIVDGQTQFVGSDEDAARAAIAYATHQPKAQVSLTRTGDALLVQVDHLPSYAKNDPAEVVLAITESGLSSTIGGARTCPLSSSCRSAGAGGSSARRRSGWVNAPQPALPRRAWVSVGAAWRAGPAGMSGLAG